MFSCLGIGDRSITTGTMSNIFKARSNSWSGKANLDKVILSVKKFRLGTFDILRFYIIMSRKVAVRIKSMFEYQKP